MKNKTLIPNSVVEILSKFSDTELAKIACNINSWEFPEELKSLHPSLYYTYDTAKVYRDLVYLSFRKAPMEYKEHSDFFKNTLSPIRVYISNTIGERAVSKYHNTIHRTDEGKMNDEQFNLWWNSKENLHNNGL